MEQYIGDYTFLGGDEGISQDQTALESLSTYAAANRKELMIDVTGNAALSDERRRQPPGSPRRPAEPLRRAGMEGGYRLYGGIGCRTVLRRQLDRVQHLAGRQVYPVPRPSYRPADSSPQREELTRKRINFFTNYGRRNLLSRKVRPALRGIGSILKSSLLWFIDAVQSDTFSALSPTPFPRV